MKALSWILGLVGLVVVVLAVLGRFYHLPTITLMGQSHAAASVILVGNTILLLGVLAALLGKKA